MLAVLLVGVLALGLLPACGSPAAVQPPGLPVTPAAAPALDGWQVLYRRPGWSGGATVDLRAVGDVMLGRVVGTIARRQGLEYPLALARPLLAGDLAIGNLEGPLTRRREPLRPGPYRLPADPAFAAPLHAAGFAALSLANNHALDIGAPGLRDTAAALRAADIAPLGAGAEQAAARAPAIVAAGGLRVALLGFNDVGDPEDRADEGQGEWGRAWLNDEALASVRAARGAADLVVVIVHWGEEYAAQPSARQRDWAARLVAAGADLIVGAHPHVLQPAAPIEAGGRHGYVAYSLGNFIFDQFDRPETSTSVVLRALLDRQGVALVAAAPIAITAGQARPLALDSPAAQPALAALGSGGAQSAPNAHFDAWRWDGSAASPLDAPPGTPLPAPSRRTSADLRGDGRPLAVSVDDSGLALIRDGPGDDAPVVWRNEAPDWRVTRVVSGDLNGDGRIEVLLLLWRPDAGGRLRSHPFLVGWRGGRFGVLWGGSATATPLQDIAAGDLDGDGREELVVLEGGASPGDRGAALSVWRWQGWMFVQQWRSSPGVWSRLALRDIDGDGRPDIVAQRAE